MSEAEKKAREICPAVHRDGGVVAGIVCLCKPIATALQEAEDRLKQAHLDNEALNKLVRKTTGLGQGEIDGYAADREELRATLAARDAEIERLKKTITKVRCHIEQSKKHDLMTPLVLALRIIDAALAEKEGA